MPRITVKHAACIGLSALLAVGAFAGPASARWYENGNNNYYNDNYNNRGYQNQPNRDRDWNNNGYYYRDPPVVYSPPERYYYPPPVVYGPEINLPGVTIRLQ